MSEQQTVDVNDALREFVDAIKDCEQYRTFREARERLDEDDDAQQLLQTYQEKQIQLQRGGHDQEVMAELRDVKREMDDNETINEYMQAEKTLIELLDQTNDVISERIDEEFARSTGGGCC